MRLERVQRTGDRDKERSDSETKARTTKSELTPQWDADTNDDNFLIDFLPHTDNRVLLATGGSYHGFKFFPILGKYIVQALEGKLDAVAKKAWAWRPELPNPYTTRGKGETYELKRQEYHL